MDLRTVASQWHTLDHQIGALGRLHLLEFNKHLSEILWHIKALPPTLNIARGTTDPDYWLSAVSRDNLITNLTSKVENLSDQMLQFASIAHQDNYCEQFFIEGQRTARSGRCSKGQIKFGLQRKTVVSNFCPFLKKFLKTFKTMMHKRRLVFLEKWILCVVTISWWSGGRTVHKS